MKQSSTDTSHAIPKKRKAFQMSQDAGENDDDDRPCIKRRAARPLGLFTTPKTSNIIPKEGMSFSLLFALPKLTNHSVGNNNGESQQPPTGTRCNGEANDDAAKSLQQLPFSTSADTEMSG